jgi:Snare region anchored in the vesicle membrane C-terminus
MCVCVCVCVCVWKLGHPLSHLSLFRAEVATGIREKLLDQRDRLKSVQRRILDIGVSLGITSQLVRFIERRQNTYVPVNSLVAVVGDVSVCMSVCLLIWLLRLVTDRFCPAHVHTLTSPHLSPTHCRDKYILYGGMLFTLGFLFWLWWYVHW